MSTNANAHHDVGEDEGAQQSVSVEQPVITAQRVGMRSPFAYDRPVADYPDDLDPNYDADQMGVSRVAGIRPLRMSGVPILSNENVIENSLDQSALKGCSTSRPQRG